MSTYDEEHGIADQTERDGNATIRQQVHDLLELQQDNDNAAAQAVLTLLLQLLPAEWQQQELENGGGCSDEFIDSLPRVDPARLRRDDTCPICHCTYWDAAVDNNNNKRRVPVRPLAVELPHCGHRYDLECLSLWLARSRRCPLCRDDVTAARAAAVVDTSAAELLPDHGMYG